MAELIAESLEADIFEIKPQNPYPEDYQTCTEQAEQEKNSNARPALKADITIEDYDVIFLGYPVWWSDMPMPVYTFIEKHDWAGKTLIPFCTHEGSGMSPPSAQLSAACKGATLKRGLALRGATAQNNISEARRLVVAWLDSLF